MVILIRSFFLISALLIAPLAQAADSQDGEMPDPHADQIQQQAKKLCQSTDEYIKTLGYLRTTKDILIPEGASRKVAERVSRGCDGAADRFIQILKLMKTVGLSDPKSLEIALDFAGYSPEVQKNFSAIFTRAFLAEFFDYDYNLAVGLALELSKNYQGDPAQVRDDFIALAKFCKDAKNIDLPSRTCAEYTIKLARLSELYPHGIRQPFFDFYKKMREDKDFSLDVKTSLDLTYNVLKNGPTAADNFFKAYAFAMKDDGLGLSRNGSLEFGLKMAARSYSGEKPPVLRALANVDSP